MKEETKNKQTYCVYRYTTPNNEIYIGVTNNPKRRCFPSLYKGTSLAPFIDNYGWGAITKEIVASGLAREVALKLEDQLIVDARNNGVSVINSYRSGYHKDSEEFKNEQRVLGKVRSKTWRDTHQEQHADSCKAWRKANPDYYREYRKRKKAEKEAKQAQQSDVEKVKPTKPKQKRKRPLF